VLHRAAFLPKANQVEPDIAVHVFLIEVNEGQSNTPFYPLGEVDRLAGHRTWPSWDALVQMYMPVMYSVS
jgi:hypothetical protein